MTDAILELGAYQFLVVTSEPAVQQIIKLVSIAATIDEVAAHCVRADENASPGESKER